LDLLAAAIVFSQNKVDHKIKDSTLMQQALRVYTKHSPTQIWLQQRVGGVVRKHIVHVRNAAMSSTVMFIASVKIGGNITRTHAGENYWYDYLPSSEEVLVCSLCTISEKESWLVLMMEMTIPVLCGTNTE
jgi:hypothetical protein